MKNNNKTIIITGASSGIGKALAKLYAQRGGFNVVLAARRLHELELIISDLKKDSTAHFLAVQTDVSKEDDCKNLIASTVDAFGGIDILINNAGISMRALFEDLNLDVLRRLMDVNFWGTVYCSKYALPWLLQAKGSLVGVISIAGYVGLPARTGYAASKFAVRGFLDTLRIENLKKGLHVLVAAPGFTASEIRKTALNAGGGQQGETPRNESEMMTADEVARHIAKAIDKRKRKIILTFVEGKVTVCLSKFFPKMLDKMVYKHMAKEPDSPFK